MLRRLATAVMASPPSKRPRASSAGRVLIGTHNGHFHADEALAVHMLRMLPSFRDADLVRTRDAAVLSSCNIVVDVGGEYDVAAQRFDHHQRSFAVTFPGRETKLSSAGLVFLHFGRAIIAGRLGPEVAEDMPEVELLHKKLYHDFIEALDAHDNGIAAYDPAALAAAGLKKRFSDGAFSLAAVVARYNLNWNDELPADPVEAQRLEDDRFLSASRRIGDEFERELDYRLSAWLPARSVVEKAFAARSQFDPAGRLLVFEGKAAPWKDHLYELEDGSASVLYVLYPEKVGPDAKWRIQCVPESRDSFVSRKPLPEAWRGLRDEELDAASGLEGGVFVHTSGFIGGNKTFEGAKLMAHKALSEP